MKNSSFSYRLAKFYCIMIPERTFAGPTDVMHSNRTGYEITNALLKWPQNDWPHQDEGEKDRAASSLLELLGTRSEETDEHDYNEEESSSGSGESWDSDF